MNGNAYVPERLGSPVVSLPGGLTPEAALYRVISALLPSHAVVVKEARCEIQVDYTELARLVASIPTSTLSSVIAIQSGAPTARRVQPATPTPADRRYQAWLALPLHAQLAEVSAALSLNKTQLAEVLDVSRPTIYQWMDERRVVADDRADTSRLTTLLRLMAQAGISGTDALNARFTKVPLQIHGRGLLAMLYEKSWDEASVLAGLVQARDLTRAARQAQADREARLQAEGFVAPSAVEREANLERNLFLEGLDAP